MKYKWLLFDADGTLFDYNKAEALALQATFEQFGHVFEPEYLEAYRKINERVFQLYAKGSITTQQVRYDRFEQLSEVLGIGLDYALFGDAHIYNLAKGVYLIDGAEEIRGEEFFDNCIVDEEIGEKVDKFPRDFVYYKNGDIYFFVWSAIEYFYR